MHNIYMHRIEGVKNTTNLEVAYYPNTNLQYKVAVLVIQYVQYIQS